MPPTSRGTDPLTDAAIAARTPIEHFVRQRADEPTSAEEPTAACSSSGPTAGSSPSRTPGRSPTRPSPRRPRGARHPARLPSFRP
jgi:hypothetical protein